MGSAFWSNYDALAEDLANHILEQIVNDTPPAIETGNNIDTETENSEDPATIKPVDAELTHHFARKENRFLLTVWALNDRLNGGVLAKDTQDAVNYLYDQNLTRYSTVTTFQADKSLRRDEAAKFFSMFTKQVIKSPEDSTKECSFADAEAWHSDLQGDIVSACRLGIFKGSNGKFYPTNTLTNGEALTVLMRIIYGPMSETDPEHRAKNYREKAQSYGLTQGTLIDSSAYLDQPITRGDVARLLEAARFIPLVKKELGGDIVYSLSTQGYTLKQ